MAVTPTKTSMGTTADDELIESEIDTLLGVPLRVIGVKSPSLAPRKTRIISSSSRRDSTFLSSPLKSPLRISVVPSPGAGSSFRSSVVTHLDTSARDSPEFSQFSLRRSKQRARIQKHHLVLPQFLGGFSSTGADQTTLFGSEDPVPVEEPLPVRRAPPSLRHQQRWNSQRATTSARSQCVLDEDALPVIQPSSSSGWYSNGYVTRSLFPESSSSQNDVVLQSSEPVNTSQVITRVTLPVIVGVERDVLTDMELLGSVECHSDFICCELLDEFTEDRNNVSKVRVRLFHSGQTVETFRSCCEFTDRFATCANHVVLPETVVCGMQTEGIISEAAMLLEGTLLSQDFSSGSEDEWVMDDDGDANNAGLGSESDSDWESYASEICEEDLPRLGLVKLDEEFHNSLFEWRMADEFWASHRTDYSHETKFQGSNSEPLPDWFFPSVDSTPELQPIHFFNKMFPLETMRMIVRETNRYAIVKLGEKWSALTVTEFSVWLGSALYMTLARRPDRRLHWAKHSYPLYNHGIIGSFMSRARFEQILSCLHLANNEEIVTDKTDPGYCKVRKVLPFLQALNGVFKALKPVDHKLTLDEMTVHTGGRYCPVSQYNAKKPIKHHIKIFAVCSATSRYCYNLTVYSGKVDADKTSVADIVLKELEFVHKHANHHITMDNWFTSVQAFLALLALGILATGTFRLNRSGWPESLRNKSLKLNRGNLTWRMHVTRSISAAIWMDNHPVALLSTSAPPYDLNCTVNRWDRKAHARIVVPTSPMLVEYTQLMRGVDVHDQLRTSYSTSLKTRKWWHRLFWFGVDTKFTNSYVLYVLYHREFTHRGIRSVQEISVSSEAGLSTTKRLSHARFLLSIADELVREKKTTRAGSSQLSGYPMHHSLHGETRRNCCVCKKLTNISCPTCNWRCMCLGPCFLAHHARPDCCSKPRRRCPKGWQNRKKGFIVGRQVRMVGVKRVTITHGIRQASAGVT